MPPTYEFECPDCGYTKEEFLPITHSLKKRCPECGKMMQTIISGGAGIIFKGEGFYETDYKRKDKKGHK